MAGLNSIDDSNWAEVKHINSYAMFMGYLWMAMRGLGLLVVMWTTVVLLGGFVSILNKKDFWCLTLITVVQTAGVFNTHPSENLVAVPRLCFNFLHTMNITITSKEEEEEDMKKMKKKKKKRRLEEEEEEEEDMKKKQKKKKKRRLEEEEEEEGAEARIKKGPICQRLTEPSGHLCVGARKLVALGMALIQAIVFSIILCPVAALYGFGLYITTAIALWRLIEHDYGSSGGETTNMNPAIFVLYVLAVLQGAIFCYRGLLRFTGKKIANQVAQGYKFEEGVDSLVLGYLDEARMGCEKDTSFSRGRNLITYAMDRMESNSPDGLLSGTRILDTLIIYDKNMRPVGDPQNCRRIPMVMERLIGPSSSGKIFQKLLKTLDSRSSCDKEMTKRAANIVLSLAGDIYLRQFPEGLGYISSLLDASQREVNEYKQLMLQGLLIIEKIVTHEDNCIFIMSYNYSEFLLGKVLKPLSSNILHRVSHDVCPDLVDASLKLLCTWFNTITRLGYTQLVLPNESTSAMETIVTCDKCNKERRILAMKVLVTQINIQDKENIIVQLLGIFLDYKKDKYITRLAGEKLVMLSKESKSNAKIILEANNGSVEKIIVLLSVKGNVRICTVRILEGLCSHYIASHLGKNDPCFENLKRLIIGSMPELLIEILPPLGQRSRNVSPDIVVVESQDNAVVSLDKPKQHEDKKYEVALLSLFYTVYHNMLSEEDDLRLLLVGVCSKDPEFNLPSRLSEMLERHSDTTDVDCLRIVKCIAKMATSMMRHKHIYPTEDITRLVSSSLFQASVRMVHLDTFVLLSGADRGYSLLSLVQQANRLFRSKEKDMQLEVSSKGKESEITEPSSPSTTFEKEAQTPEDIKLTEPEITELSAPSTFEWGQSSSS